MILWTTGLNKIKVNKFFYQISVLLITILQLLLAAFVNPNVLNYSRSLIKSSNLDFISQAQLKQINLMMVEGLTIFVEEKNKSDFNGKYFYKR